MSVSPRPGPSRPGVVLRPARPSDSGAVAALFSPGTDDLTGMTSLPSTPDRAEAVCEETYRTVAELAAGSFELADGQARRVLFVATDGDEAGGRVLGVTGLTFKQGYPNLAVQVTTSGDGMGLVMRSVSAPWTRVELDSSYLGPEARGRRVGTLLSRGRFMLMHIVRRQIPPVVVTHLRGVFDPDGTAPFWGCFGGRFAPQWPTSVEAEAALDADPNLLAGLAGHRLELTAEVLGSLGAVNAASLPAFHLLRAEGLEPNGMYDPIDGGPTLVAEVSKTTSALHRRHGRAVESVEAAGGIDGLVSVAAVDRFRVTRTSYKVTDQGDKVTEQGDKVTEQGRVVIPAEAAEALDLRPDALVAVSPTLAPTAQGDAQRESVDR